MYKTPVIKTPEKGRKGSGSFGSYYKISKDVGVKVIDKIFTKEQISNSFIDFLNDMVRHDHDSFRSIADAARELVALQMLEGSGKTPKPIGLCWVENGDRYSIGIMMEHIDGMTLHSWARKNDKHVYVECDKMKNKCAKWMQEFGIEANDWHEWNILVMKNRQKVRIDFSPDYFHVRNSHWQEFLARVRYEVLNLVENIPQ